MTKDCCSGGPGSITRRVYYEFGNCRSPVSCARLYALLLSLYSRLKSHFQETMTCEHSQKNVFKKKVFCLKQVGAPTVPSAFIASSGE
jgi:hypothetical protein